MPLIVLGSFLIGIVLTWFILQRKYQKLIKNTVLETTAEMSDKIATLDKELVAANQKAADLEYLVKERDKDIAALKSNRDT